MEFDAAAARRVGERWGASDAQVGAAAAGCLLLQACDEIERLLAERQELWRTVSDMKAAAETAGYVFRNTDSGPALVR